MSTEAAAPGDGGERATLSPAELRELFLFESLDGEQLSWLSRQGRLDHAARDSWVFREGEPATCFYVLLDGELAMYRRVGDDDIEVLRSRQRGAYTGATQAYLIHYRDDPAEDPAHDPAVGPDAGPAHGTDDGPAAEEPGRGGLRPRTYAGSVRAVTDCTFFVIDAADFARSVQQWFPMAMHLLEGLFFGLQNSQEVIGRRERLLALGRLSAGLTHELNNPSAAAVRATAVLRDRVSGMRHKLAHLAGGSVPPDVLRTLTDLQERAVLRAAEGGAGRPTGALATADAEDAVSDWFDERDITDGWELAPVLVAAGVDEDFLDEIEAAVPAEFCEGAVRWVAYGVETELLMREIEDATRRISDLVGAAAQYSQLDRAPFQEIDIHDGLESTLTMLARALGEGVTVVREYDRSLPPVPAYPAELNQVWTNLIDNARDAMAGDGTLTIRTARENDHVLVEICDTGPGVPAEIAGRIFEPFYTTKPVGKGTGLGLDISWRIVAERHGGDVKVASVPGDTRFQVRLPLVARQSPD